MGHHPIYKWSLHTIQTKALSFFSFKIACTNYSVSLCLCSYRCCSRMGGKIFALPKNASPGPPLLYNKLPSLDTIRKCLQQRQSRDDDSSTTATANKKPKDTTSRTRNQVPTCPDCEVPWTKDMVHGRHYTVVCINELLKEEEGKGVSSKKIKE